MKEISKNNLIQSLRLEGVNANPSKDFENRLKNQLRKKSNSFNLVNFLIMKNKSLKYKIAVIIPALLFMSLASTAAVNPALAQEVTNKIFNCGVDFGCYEKIKETTNEFGTKVEVLRTYEYKDENGQIVRNFDNSSSGMVSHASYPDYLKIMDSLNGKKISENDNEIIYVLPRGSKIQVQKPSSENGNKGALISTGAFWNDTEDISQKVFGQVYIDAYVNDETKRQYKERDHMREELLKIDIDKVSDPKVLERYFDNLPMIKVQNDQPSKDVSIYEFNGKVFKSVRVENNTKYEIYDNETGKFIYRGVVKA